MIFAAVSCYAAAYRFPLSVEDVFPRILRGGRGKDQSSASKMPILMYIIALTAPTAIFFWVSNS